MLSIWKGGFIGGWLFLFYAIHIEMRIYLMYILLYAINIERRFIEGWLFFSQCYSYRKEDLSEDSFFTVHYLCRKEDLSEGGFSCCVLFV